MGHPCLAAVLLQDGVDVLRGVLGDRLEYDLDAVGRELVENGRVGVVEGDVLEDDLALRAAAQSAGLTPEQALERMKAIYRGEA